MIKILLVTYYKNHHTFLYIGVYFSTHSVYTLAGSIWTITKVMS